jgi:F0F1-type ATP synthase epsilon subunit
MSDNNENEFTVDGGFAEVSNNIVSVCIESV